MTGKREGLPEPGEIFLSDGVSDLTDGSTNLSTESYWSTYPGPNATVHTYMTGLDMFVFGDGIMEEFHFYIMHVYNVK